MKTEVIAANQYKKGEMILNTAGWPGIVIEATRGNNPSIVIVEMYGIEHESGSIYTNEIVKRLNRAEFETYKANLGHAQAEKYYKGDLVDQAS